MRIALRALERRSDTVVRTLAADDAVATFVCVNGVMILGERNRRIRASTCLYSLPVAREQLHQGMHKLLSEIELPWSFLPNRPELEGIDDAHIEQPPC